MDSAIETLAARRVKGRPVKARVIEDMRKTREALAARRKAKRRPSTKRA